MTTSRVHFRIGRRTGRAAAPPQTFCSATSRCPPGILLFEDPPLHDLHRRLLSRVFTPRRMLAVEELRLRRRALWAHSVRGVVHVAPQRFGQPRRDEIRRTGPLRHSPQGWSPQLWPRAAFLPRLGTGATLRPRCARRGPQTMDRLGRRLRQRQPSADVWCARLGEAIGQDRADANHRHQECRTGATRDRTTSQSE
jgi:hypothetical protein